MRSLFAAVLLSALAACDSGSTGPATGVVLTGSWTYTATQTLPQLAMTGTLSITDQSGSEINGALAYEETDAQGIVRNRVGRINGRVRSSTTVDFDAFIDDAALRHVGSFAGDSLSGTWIDNTGGNTRTGRFVAKRRSP